jgi:hypothetical protein
LFRRIRWSRIELFQQLSDPPHGAGPDAIGELPQSVLSAILASAAAGAAGINAELTLSRLIISFITHWRDDQLSATVTVEIRNMFGRPLPGFSWELPLTDANYPKLAKNTLRTTYPNLPDAFSVRIRISDRVLGFWSHNSQTADNATKGHLLPAAP